MSEIIIRRSGVAGPAGPDTEAALAAFTTPGETTGAGMIPFLPIPAAASPRSTQVKLRDMYLTPEDFAYDGIIARTDTEKLQAFFDALGGGQNGRIDKDYTIDDKILISAKSNFYVACTGKITAADTMPVSSDKEMLHFEGCTHFYVEGLRVDGNRAGRGAAEQPAQNIRMGSCHYFVFRDCISDNAPVDGWIFNTTTPSDTSTHNSHFILEDCWADNAYRNGMSVAQANHVLILGGGFTNTNGTIPQAGIDLEADPGNPDNSLQHIVVKGTYFAGNSGYGINVSQSKPRNIVFEDLVLIDNVKGAISWAAISGSIVRPFISGHTNSATRGAIDISATAGVGNVVIDRPIFRNVTANTGTRPLVYVHGSSAGNVTVRDINVDSCRQVVNFQAPNCRLIGGRADGVTAFGAVNMQSDGGVCEGFTCTNYTLGVVIVNANRVRVSDCDFYDYASNNEWGSIFWQSGTNGICERNTVRQSTPVSNQSAFRADVELDRFVGNRIIGYTGSAQLNVTAAPAFQDDNSIDGLVIDHDFQALTDQANITANLVQGRFWTVTLGGNRTLVNPTNMRVGQTGSIAIKQDATGSRTLAFGSAWKFEGGSKTLSTAANTIDVIDYEVVDANTIYASLRKAFS